MERDVLDEATRKKMELDGERIQRRLRDPAATMEARHQQVRVSPPAVRIRGVKLAPRGELLHRSEPPAR